MHARLRGSKSLLTLYQIIYKTWFPFLSRWNSRTTPRYEYLRCRLYSKRKVKSYTAYEDNARTHLATWISKMSFIRIMLCAWIGQCAYQTSVRSSDLSTIEHAKDTFGQRVGRIILAPRNTQAFNGVLQEESRLIPKYQIIKSIQEYVKSVQVPISGTLVTEGILIFQTLHLRLSR